MFEEVGGKGVAQHVGADAFADAAGPGLFVDDLPEAQPGHGGTAGGEKEKVAAPFLEQPGTSFFEVGGEPFPRLFAEGHQSLLAALAQHPHVAAGEVCRRHREIYQFGNPHAGGVEQVQHGMVAEQERRRGGGGAEQPIHLGDGQHLGQAAARLGQVDVQRRVGGDQFVGDQKAEEGAQAGDAAGVAAVRDAAVPAMAEKVTDVGGGDIDRRGDAAFGDKVEKGSQVGLVGGEGVVGQPPFGGQIVQEQVLKSQ